MNQDPLPYPPQMRNGGAPPAHLPSSPHSDPAVLPAVNAAIVAAVVSALESSLVAIPAMSAEKVLAEEQHCHEAAAREKALADKANKRHQAAAREKALADKANKRHQATAREKALADEAHKQRQTAEHATTLAVTALTKLKATPKVRYGGPPPTHFSPPLTATEVAELDAAILDKCRCHKTAAREKALAEDKQRQEETAEKQHRADNEHAMVPVLPPDPGNAAIRHIQVECALLAAPLDAILAKIERDNIAHEARAPPTTTLPHPAAMLSTSPPPMTYVGAVLSTMGGSSQATSLTLAPVALPSPAIDGKLQMVRRRARPHRRVAMAPGLPIHRSTFFAGGDIGPVPPTNLL
jgi:hypothetical protein